jgi:hypothetical protein
MSFMHILNLYADQTILLFCECYVMEKVHGSSAHLSWNERNLNYSAGGASHASFVALFDDEALKAKFKELVGDDKVVVYGEVYGGSMQKMSDVYGKSLAFIAFDVQRAGRWLTVPEANAFCDSLEIEFVPWHRCSTDIAELAKHRDAPSEVAVRRGCGSDKQREGIVLRPVMEFTNAYGERVIAKHKTDKFRETTTPRDASIDPAKLQVLADAQAIADEWCSAMRLLHVLDKLPGAKIRDMKKVLDAMVEDVQREGAKEIVWSKDAEAAIRKTTAVMFKKLLQSAIEHESK